MDDKERRMLEKKSLERDTTGVDDQTGCSTRSFHHYAYHRSINRKKGKEIIASYPIKTDYLDVFYRDS